MNKLNDLDYTEKTKEELTKRIKESENGLTLFCEKTNNGMATTTNSLLEEVARDCRKFGTVFPEPSIHKL